MSSRFQYLTVDMFIENELFFKYVYGKICKGKKGGSFISNYEVAPPEFRKYGIVLPRGGMIIPHMEPDALKAIHKQAWQILRDQKKKELDQAQAARDAVEQEYLDKVSKLLGKYNIPGLCIVGCLHTSVNCSWGAAIGEVFFGMNFKNATSKVMLAFSEAAAFLLRTERDPGSVESSVWYEELGKVEEFLKIEAKLYPKRKEVIEKLVALDKENTRLYEDREVKGRPVYERYIWRIAYDNRQSGDLFFYPLQPGFKSAHCIRYRGERLSVDEYGVDKLEKMIKKG